MGFDLIYSSQFLSTMMKAIYYDSHGKVNISGHKREAVFIDFVRIIDHIDGWDFVTKNSIKNLD